MSVIQSVGPARSPGEGQLPGSLAFWPKAPWAPSQLIHLGPHGGHFLRQACQGCCKLVQPVCEGSTKVVQFLLQGLATGAWWLERSGWPL